MSEPIILRKQPHYQDDRINNPEGCCSSDAVSIYADGSGMCFSCGKQLFTHPSRFNYFDWIEGKDLPDPRRSSNMNNSNYTGNQNSTQSLEIEKRMYEKALFKGFPDRNISIQTAQKFGVRTDGNGNTYFPYYNRDNHLCGFKIRTPDKQFRVVGKVVGEDVQLFGQQLFKAGGKYVTIHEGEFDALAGFQMMGSKFPHMSIPTGSKGAKKACQLNLDYLESYDRKVISFDGDKPGKDASEATAPLFSPGTCQVMDLPEDMKDACEYSKAGMGGAYYSLFWDSRVFTPSGIVNLGDNFEELFNRKTRQSHPYPWEALNEKTRGFRKKELVTLCSGAGMGWIQPLCTVRCISKPCEFGGSPIRNPEGNTELSFDIPNFPNYSILPSGRVWSNVRNKYLKPDLNSAGYQRVTLSTNGKVKRFTIHKLMAYVFYSLPLDERVLVVNHIDGVKTHNHISNLEIVTRRENQLHAIRKGLQGSLENSASAKITNKTAHVICELLSEGYSVSSIVAIGLPNVTKDIIYDIKRGRTWRPIMEQYH